MLYAHVFLGSPASICRGMLDQVKMCPTRRHPVRGINLVVFIKDGLHASKSWPDVVIDSRARV